MERQHRGDQPPMHTNQLIHESSPYLLQHAHNPVDWYPWGEEALTRARAEDKPILLSVGYSACHWCHVMAHESFENEATAALMNENFVNIKVDREERPDIDALYMEATIRMTGGGGWPMTAFLTPDGAPFFTGTYFPPVDRYGAPGFPRLLERVAGWYRERRDEVEAQAQAMRDIYQAQERQRFEVPPGLLDGTEMLDPAILARAANTDLAGFDTEAGGLRGAPKFPHALGLEFLLRMERRRQSRGETESAATLNLNPNLLPLVALTLDKMANGGIFDQIGGGFHRYSTDAVWLTPHFEKMLYDNALLALVYLRAWQVTHEARYRVICERTLDYILREMTDPSGAFSSSQDADSEGEEGRFYVWTAEELGAALGDADAAVAQLVWGVSEQGNFEGRNILHVVMYPETAAASLGIAPDEARAALDRSRERLYEVRARRVWPGRDDKAITSWNALALRALAEAALALGRDDYRQAAVKSAGFLDREMVRDGKVLRSWRQGVAKLDGYLEDYAGLANALISVYELTADPQYVTQAHALADTIVRRFWDEEVSGFFDTAADHERLIGRPREIADNVTPSGNSLAAEALLRLAALTGKAEYRELAVRALLPNTPLAVRSPSGFGRALCAIDDLIGPFFEVAVIGPAGDTRVAALREVATRDWRPRIVLATSAPGDQVAASAVPLLAERPLVNGSPAAYVCQGFVCQRPVTEAGELAALLDA
ncbi:MAG TPA: thioredoxin domain-containing protein [Ktedonobacterales bacterium]|nr:thioredoxin domain-containing protein [Ktedonobacterales bacterium]